MVEKYMTMIIRKVLANQTLGGFASTTNPNDAKVFNLEMELIEQGVELVWKD